MNSKTNHKKLRIWLAAAGLFVCLIGGTVSAYAQNSPDAGTAAATQTESETAGDSKDASTDKEKDSDKEPTGGEGTMDSGVNTKDSGDTANAAQGSGTKDNKKENTEDQNDQDNVPEGNLTISEDIVSGENGSREFLTVYSRQGDVFYIIINRDNNGTGNVYFLNTVDDTDLYSLTGQEAPAASTAAANTAAANTGSASLLGGTGTDNVICICADKCEEDHVNTTCPLCRLNLEECEGAGGIAADKSAAADPADGTEQKPELNLTSLIIGGVAIIFLVILYFVKLRKPKKKAPVEEFDMDEYDLDDEGEE